MSDESSGEFRHNHYVPDWYQRRFLPCGASRFWYLDLHPEFRTNSTATWTRRELLHRGPSSCFAQNDLYTTNWGALTNTDIEKFFFGKIDADGKTSMEFFAKFAHPSVSESDFKAFLRYMSVQKLRTPKGLAALRRSLKLQDQYFTLAALQHHRDFHCATWAECIWQIADASRSATKFIISDHPVTVYNRECFPESPLCKGFGDPDIRQVGSQTYFPLSSEKVLILTNLSWVRDPYQSALAVRPNPAPYRATAFNFLDIQVDRFLLEEEVIEINYITKRRALRYIAAAEKDWLYPEKRLRDDHWRKLGDGYLLMPEPRHIHMGGNIIIGYGNGRSESFSEYGHRPWQIGYKDEARERRESNALERFKAEWAATYGPDYRGMNAVLGGEGRRTKDSDSAEIHTHYLELDAKARTIPGERKRRRSFRRKELK